MADHVTLHLGELPYVDRDRLYFHVVDAMRRFEAGGRGVRVIEGPSEPRAEEDLYSNG
jgi:hypothetical protein